ncbi:hypothetical protein BZA77DRAFT_363115 [Pyronema omphalodes]|nr:hypothetical protein BZA77DRAFT_363115 [Pyronema omphalodes]
MPFLEREQGGVGTGGVSQQQQLPQPPLSTPTNQSTHAPLPLDQKVTVTQGQAPTATITTQQQPSQQQQVHKRTYQAATRRKRADSKEIPHTLRRAQGVDPDEDPDSLFPVSNVNGTVVNIQENHCTILMLAMNLLVKAANHHEDEDDVKLESESFGGSSRSATITHHRYPPTQHTAQLAIGTQASSNKQLAYYTSFTESSSISENLDRGGDEAAGIARLEQVRHAEGLSDDEDKPNCCTPDPPRIVRGLNDKIGNILQPADRSDRMSWHILGNALALASELGVFDTDPPEHLAARLLRIQRTLQVHTTQLASRLGRTSMIPKPLTVPTTPIPPLVDPKNLDALHDTFYLSWSKITKIMTDSSAALFASPATTQDLTRSSQYIELLNRFNPLLDFWHEEFLTLNLPSGLHQILLLEYEHVRFYSTQLGNGLKHAPVRVSLRILSAAMFLLKSFAVGAGSAEIGKSLMMIRNATNALKEGGADGVHLANVFADMLGILAKSVEDSLVWYCGRRTGRGADDECGVAYIPGSAQHLHLHLPLSTLTPWLPHQPLLNTGINPQVTLASGTAGTLTSSASLSSAAGGGLIQDNLWDWDAHAGDWTHLPFDNLLEMNGEVQRGNIGANFGEVDLLEAMLGVPM